MYKSFLSETHFIPRLNSQKNFVTTVRFANEKNLNFRGIKRVTRAILCFPGGGSLMVLPLETKGRQSNSSAFLHAHSGEQHTSRGEGGGFVWCLLKNCIEQFVCVISDFVSDFDFSSFDDQRLATCSFDGTVSSWTCSDSPLFDILCLTFRSSQCCLSFSTSLLLVVSRHKALANVLGTFTTIVGLQHAILLFLLTQPRNMTIRVLTLHRLKFGLCRREV